MGSNDEYANDTLRIFSLGGYRVSRRFSFRVESAEELWENVLPKAVSWRGKSRGDYSCFYADVRCFPYTPAGLNKGVVLEQKGWSGFFRLGINLAFSSRVGISIFSLIFPEKYQ